MNIFKVQMHRLVAFASCLILVLTCVSLAGCKKDNKNPSKNNNNGEVSLGSVKEALKHGSDETLDFGGKTLTISAWGNPTPAGTDPYKDRMYELQERTEKKYNVNIEWVPSNTATFVKDVQLAFASKQKYADLIFAPSNYAFDVCRLGAVVPLDDYIDYTSPHYAVTGNNLLYVDGKHYSYMPDEYGPNSLGYFITYNTTMLEIANCEDPYELYKEGKWTWNEFAEIVKKTTIVNSNGKASQWGIGGSNLLDALCLSNGFQMIGMDTENKKFTCNLYTDEGLNVLNFVKKLCYDYKGCDGRYGGHNSKINFGDSKLAMLICPSYYPGEYVQKGMTVATVPLPKGPDAKGYVNGLELQEWWMVSAISDFSTKDLVQLALDMNDNDPAFEETYFSEEGKKENFITRVYDTCVVATEEEAEFFYDFIRDKEVTNMLNISTPSLKSLISEKVFGPISLGEDPRGVLTRVKPVINESLNEMLPESLK